ncbi:MAG TPA: hypothetical protein PKL61_12940, partial [Accumulibacter sp.]|uniref:hypothetical protein n=1 Tax=Accumulibacter sp. TaxID=2053492 RepID=UPI002CCF1C61
MARPRHFAAIPSIFRATSDSVCIHWRFIRYLATARQHEAGAASALATRSVKFSDEANGNPSLTGRRLAGKLGAGAIIFSFLRRSPMSLYRLKPRFQAL